VNVDNKTRLHSGSAIILKLEVLEST